MSPKVSRAVDLASGRRGGYQGLAELATNDETLLPNEDFSTTYVEDADHWITVFSELLAFKLRLIATAQEIAGSMQREGKEEVETTDLVLLNAERKRFEDHLERWRQRREELSGS